MRLLIRVKPSSARTRVGGDYDGALVVAVTAPAVEGRATDAAVRAVAKALGLSARDVRVVTGATARTKLLEIADGAVEPSELAVRVERLRAGAAPGTV